MLRDQLGCDWRIDGLRRKSDGGHAADENRIEIDGRKRTFNVHRPTSNEEERRDSRENSFTHLPNLLASSMDLSTIANVATALTVLTGVAFGLIEMRRPAGTRRTPPSRPCKHSSLPSG